MNNQIIVTDEGLKKLQEELNFLKTTKRKEVTEAIKLALSESLFDEGFYTVGRTEVRNV